MIKNTLKRWGLVLIIAPFLSISCTEEFLETELTGAATEDVYYSTVNGISQLVVGTYAVVNTVVPNLHSLDVMYLGFGSFASDEAEAGGEAGGNVSHPRKEVTAGLITRFHPPGSLRARDGVLSSPTLVRPTGRADTQLTVLIQTPAVGRLVDRHHTDRVVTVLVVGGAAITCGLIRDHHDTR